MAVHVNFMYMGIEDHTTAPSLEIPQSRIFQKIKFLEYSSFTVLSNIEILEKSHLDLSLVIIYIHKISRNTVIVSTINIGSSKHPNRMTIIAHVCYLTQ